MTFVPHAHARALLPLAAASLSTALLATSPASAATPDSLTRSVEVQASPTAVWAAIGPYCAIGEWHPAIASCGLDGRSPPTRTLLTREGQARFVERQVARDDRRRSYTYSFTSSPLPVSHYRSTFSVRPSGPHASVVTWSGVYMPDPGQAAAAKAALAGIYETGLAAIKDDFAAKSAAR